MEKLNPLFLTALIFFFAASQAHADIRISCGGYSPKLNDHVEWEIKLSGNRAHFEGEDFDVSASKKFFVLISPQSQIRINRVTKSYVIVGARGKKTSRLEWSRKVPGEGCDISD